MWLHLVNERAGHSVVSDSLQPHGATEELSGLLCRWDLPGKNSAVGNHSHLQGVFLTQGSNPGLLHCRHILYHLSHWGSPFCREQKMCASQRCTHICIYNVYIHTYTSFTHTHTHGLHPHGLHTRISPVAQQWRICLQCNRSGFDPWWGRSPGGGHGNPLQYSCLENPIDRGAWWATVHRLQRV